MKILELVKKNKADILIVLGAVIAICTQLASKGVNGIAMSIVIASVAAAIELMKNGFTENAIKLISEAIVIIITALQKEKATEETLRTKNDQIMVAANHLDKLTAGDIEVMLRDSLK